MSSETAAVTSIKPRSERWGAGQNAAPDEARERIIQAARDCYLQRSIEATTMEHIAAKACIGRATLYRYFANREAVLRAVFRGMLSDFLSQLGQAAGPSVGFCDLYLHYLVYIVRYGPATPMYTTFFSESTALWVSRIFVADPELAAILHRFFEPSFNAARERGELAADAELSELLDASGRVLISMLLIPGTIERNEAQLRIYFERYILRAIRR